jgi:hypothetical protein
MPAFLQKLTTADRHHKQEQHQQNLNSGVALKIALKLHFPYLCGGLLQ